MNVYVDMYIFSIYVPNEFTRKYLLFVSTISYLMPIGNTFKTTTNMPQFGTRADSSCGLRTQTLLEDLNAATGDTISVLGSGTGKYMYAIDVTRRSDKWPSLIRKKNISH